MTGQMMEYFDSHAHFEGDDSAEQLTRARFAGVTRVMAVGGNGELNAGVRRAVGRVPEGVSLGAALGLDRSCCDMAEEDVARFESGFARARKELPIVALGEIGLDYYYAPESARRQCAMFERMLALAARESLPVIIHTREADADTLALLGAHVAGGAGGLAAAGRAGVIHCFTGTAEMARKFLDLGFMMSFSGIVTFRNAGDLRETAKLVPDDRLMIETDSPYLTPVPLRGRPNEPAFVVNTAACLARERGVDISRIAEATTANARRLFGMA